MTDAAGTIQVEDLSSDQKPPYEAILSWVEGRGRFTVPGQRDEQVLTLAGFAGTGKTTVLAVLARALQGRFRIAFCALTGKAAGVLRRKLAASGITTGLGSDFCGTIHSLMYHAKEDPRTGVVRWVRKPALDYDLIIADEASMIPESVYADLKGYDVPILAVGDHGQLPPVSGNFSLMKDPLLRLEKIHRQAEGNPIIRLSAHIRNTGELKREFADGKHIRMLERSNLVSELKRMFDPKKSPAELFDQAVLCYTNRLRNWINNAARETRFTEVKREPSKHEQVICLRNANVAGPDSPRVFNGMRAFFDDTPKISKSNGHHYNARVVFPEEDLSVDASLCKYQFGQEKTFSQLTDFVKLGFQPPNWGAAGLLFDYGYGLTTHKAQGSQWADVLLCYERPGAVDEDGWKRWLYTAVTRSSDRLTIVFP